MSSPELSARLRFLNGSAHLLATTAPSTSRHLQSRRNTLMYDNELDPSEAHRRDACGACGTIVILGWKSTMQTESQPSRRRNPRPEELVMKQTKALIYKCKTCGRKTRFPLSRPSAVTRHKPESSYPKSTRSIPGQSNPEKSNGKKRVRARKRGGLEALLAAKRTGPETSGFGLGLMDFMKKT
jgi:ribonuclease MRP protein subunit SNM1